MSVWSGARPWQVMLAADAAGLRIAPTEHVGVFLVDVDRLKAVNDGLGYAAGDRLLETFAARLRNWAGDRALVVNAGRGTFGVVCPGFEDGAHVQYRADRLRVLLSQPVDFGGHQVARQVTIGYASARLDACPVADLLRRADHAFARAQALPGDVTVMYTPDMEAAAGADAQIELHLHEAVGRSQMLLYYQPEVNVRTGEILAVEALLRWEHPTRGLLTAGQFIEVAQRTGLTRALGTWALQTACRQRARWLADHPHRRFVMRVNVSPTELVDPELPELVLGILDETGVPPELLCLEMTELVPASDPDAAISNLQRLRAAGILVALDDFGAGHSSLHRFKAMPLDVLKIDREFVFGLPLNWVDPVIVRMLVDLARTWHLDLVAEGVESRAAATALLELGCWRAQGYYFVPPLPADELAALLGPGRVTSGLMAS